MSGRKKKLTAVLLTLVVLVGMLTACAPPEPKVVEVTRIVEKEIEVEKIVEATPSPRKPRLASMSAFGAELEAVLKFTDVQETKVIKGQTYHLGTVHGQDVVIVESGVSMVNAAMETQVLFDYFNVSHLIFSGISGGVNPDPRYGIGTVLVPA